MPSLDISFCSDGAKCKQRKTCWRFVGADYHEEHGMYWWQEFYKEAKETGRECKNYIAYKTEARKE